LKRGRSRGPLHTDAHYQRVKPRFTGFTTLFTSACKISKSRMGKQMSPLIFGLMFYYFPN
jgi:hypothetical protein